MSPKATPDVGEDAEELAQTELSSEGDIQEYETPESEPQPEAEEPSEATATGEAPPTSRRSRGQDAPKPAVNLDELPEFRKWKSEMDRQVQRERAQAAELERQLQDTRRQQTRAQVEAYTAKIDEAYDPNEKRQLIEHVANLRAQETMDAWAQWENYVAKRAQEAGLDPAEFKPRAYSGEVGRIQFETDLNEKARAKLQAENADLRKKTESIDEVIKREVAKALAGQGFDTVDTGQPGGLRGGNRAEWQRDRNAVQLGRMSPSAYLKKWGETTPD